MSIVTRACQQLHARILPQPNAQLPNPPHTAPAPLLRWLIARAIWPLSAATAASIVANIIQAIVPGFLGAALDAGIENGLNAHLWAIILGLALLFCVYSVADTTMSYLMIHAWMRVNFDVDRLAGRQVCTVGCALTQQASTGEIAAIVAADAQYIANFAERLPSLTGAAASFLVVCVLMLSTSIKLGIITIVGMPLVAWLVALVIKPLQRRQAHQREAQSKLTTITTDTVSGLRILRGIGGEDVFAHRYQDASQELRRRGVRVAGTQSLLMSLQVLLPGLFVAIVVWIAARSAVGGTLSAGQLITFYGYTAYLSWPLMEFSAFVQNFTRARVGANKLSHLLQVQPSAATPAQRVRLDPCASFPQAGQIVDQASHVHFTPGKLSALVAANPDVSATLATRLGRFNDADPTVTLDNRPLTQMPLQDVRASIVVSGAEAQLFTGTLREALDVRNPTTVEPVSVTDLIAAERARQGVAAADQNVRQTPQHLPGDDRLLDVLTAADAHDVLSSLDRGLAGMITEKGRSLSGGQRQRVALARALLTQAPTLVLIEPTSALDSHTESRVARRVHQLRQGRTTIVVSESPLVLETCDEVILLDAAGKECARASHREFLLRARQGDANALIYRDIVARASGSEEVQN